MNAINKKEYALILMVLSTIILATYGFGLLIPGNHLLLAILAFIKTVAWGISTWIVISKIGRVKWDFISFFFVLGTVVSFLDLLIKI